MSFYCSNDSIMSRRARETNWSRSSLGSDETWPVSLKIHLATLFHSQTAMFLIWDKGAHCFFNDACLPLIGEDHAMKSFASSAREVFFAQKESFFECIENLFKTGQAVSFAEFRSAAGGPAEAAHSILNLVPAFDDRGRIRGVLGNAWADTSRLLSETRLKASEEHLERDAEGALMGSWTLDIVRNRVFLSARCCEIFGIPESDHRHEGFDLDEVRSRLIHPADAESSIEVLNEALSKGDRYIDRFRIVRPDGQVRWIFSSGLGLRDADGKASALHGVLFDISDFRLPEERLKASESLLRNFVESMPEIAYISDRDGKVTYVNPPFKEYLGISGSILDWSWHESDTVCPEDLPTIMTRWLESWTSSKPFREKMRLKRYDGAYRWHSVQANMVRELDGSILYWCGTLTDIHDAWEKEEELKRAKAEAENASRLKSAFLANMSHEIRTPLTAILGFSSLLTQVRTDEERKLYASVIERNGRALTTIIDDILDLSKVESGRLAIHRSTFVLSDLIDEVISIFQESTDAKGVLIAVHYEGDKGQLVHSDPARLRQILINLVGNAVKFTSVGAISLRIHANFKDQENSYLRIAIKDTGIGISPEQSKELFEPFSQADNSATRKFGGTGLGLALSRRLARALGGDVAIESSELGKGSTFVMTVLNRGSEELSTPAAKRSLTELEKKIEGKKILLVEDVHDNQMLLERILTLAGARVDIASNGAECLIKVEEKDYDLILMDIQMPILDGYAATRKLREAGFDRPILAITAHSMNEERRRILEAGCNEHLAKPIDAERLLRCIGDFV